MLRVILDKGGKSPEETLMSEIISKHLGHESEKDIIDFQEELIKHGFKEYAKQ
jgi:hypothetical protein